MRRSAPFAREAQGQPAGLVSRATAAVIDLVVTLAAILFAHLAFSAIAFVTKPRAFEWPNPGPLVLATLWWVLLVIYLTIMWSVSGRTLGDQVMGLRVLTLGGDRLHGVRAFLRAIVCAVFPLGLLWCAVDRRRRGVHDLIARTHVIYDWIPHGQANS